MLGDYLSKLQRSLVTIDNVEFSGRIRGVLGSGLFTAVDNEVTTFDLLHDLWNELSSENG